MSSTATWAKAYNVRGPQGDVGQQGPQGSPGKDGQDGTLWFDGDGPPAADNTYPQGSYYFDRTNKQVYPPSQS